MDTMRGGLKVLRPLPKSPIEPSELALFLDLDGTLARFEDGPTLVGPNPRRSAILRAASRRLDGRIAIVSGRTLDDIDRILEGSVLAAAGVHGLERRSTVGVRSGRAPHPALAVVEQTLQTFADQRPGVLVERKPQSVALHFRMAPHLGAEAMDLAARLAVQWDLTLQNGKMVAELRTPGEDKGDALRAFMSEPPFLGARPLMFGDDFTDEAAFAAAASLGGYGVLVGPTRPTAATFQLPDVAAVLDWLDAQTGAETASNPRMEAKPWRA